MDYSAIIKYTENFFEFLQKKSWFFLVFLLLILYLPENIADSLGLISGLDEMIRSVVFLDHIASV